MNIDNIRKKLSGLNNDRLIQNFIAQANARYILFNTSEGNDNFPPYTIIDDNLDLLALHYLDLGCVFAENKNFEEAIGPLERGASILEFVHGAQANRKETSNYYGLVGALAYYVSFQYSKAFILIGKFRSELVIAQLIHLFVARNFSQLSAEIDKLTVDPEYTDETIAASEDMQESLRKIYEITVARALNGFIQYFYSGNQEYLQNAKSILQNLKAIAEMEQDPGIWWVIRLLLLISEGFDEASLWNAIGGYFDLDDSMLQGYIRSLVYQEPRGIYELFITQRRALRVVLERKDGCVVSIPTSSGKTRIAEIAILHCMLNDSSSKVLYVAPFRSLAFEVENSLESVLDNAGISVSHLYGGSVYSKVDESLVDDSDVIIATPEKAKAMIRGNNELLEKIKLIIIDEGHLLGDNKRLIINEMFYEELRYYMKLNDGKFLLLSAVLPNSEELAEWLTNNSTGAVYKDSWRPSDERLGILEYNGKIVNLNWESQDHERSSFNTRFVVAHELPLKPRERVVKFFPADKNEAVAATAYKLRAFGPALIFVGLKPSVFVMARAYLKSLGDDPADHVWKNRSDWRAFELACIEIYGKEDESWYSFARKGILCHNADLHTDVRLPLERLMRTDRPLVIISTSTLGQGVNLGISTVIFSTLFQAGSPITARDFWNIAGRAGRAFVDHEGKILVALNSHGLTSKQLEDERKIIRSYFDKDEIDLATSGVLKKITELIQLADNNDIDFDLLIQLIAENRLSEIQEDTQQINELFDTMDDTLLSLILSNNEGEESEQIDISWSDDFFRGMLACIQTDSKSENTDEEIIEVLQARMAGITVQIGTDRKLWRSIVKSGIPLSTDIVIEKKMPKIILQVQQYLIDDPLGENILELWNELEKILKDLPIFIEEGDSIISKDIKKIRTDWLNAISIAEISKLQNAAHIITGIYTFKLPWILNGISKKMRNLDLEVEAQKLEELAMLVETGLPDIRKVKIYQAGIRSRVYADEIGNLFSDELESRSIKEYKRDLARNKETYKRKLSKTAGEWLELLSTALESKKITVSRVSNFTLKGVAENVQTLLAKKIGGVQYLVSPDLAFIKKIKNTSKFDFSEVSNIPGIEFRYSRKRESWQMNIVNPFVQVKR